MRSGTRRVLVHHWYEGTCGMADELIRGLLALDSSPWHRDADVAVFRLSTEVVGATEGALDGARTRLLQFEQGLDTFFSSAVESKDLDEWAAMEIETKEDFVDRYAARLYFGCEADDRANALAFDTRLTPFGVRFNAIFASDIGHFDVPDMTKVVEEVDELRQEGLFTDRDFRDFVFANSVRLHGGMNPDFFKGTAVEAEAAKVLSSSD